VHTLPPEIWIPILNEVFTPLYLNDIECSKLYGGLTGRAGISRFLRVLFVCRRWKVRCVHKLTFMNFSLM
jgi:hypothetical protein